MRNTPVSKRWSQLSQLPRGKQTAKTYCSLFTFTQTHTHRPHLHFGQLPKCCVRLRSEWLTNRFQDGCQGGNVGGANGAQPRPAALRGEDGCVSICGSFADLWDPCVNNHDQQTGARGPTNGSERCEEAALRRGIKESPGAVLSWRKGPGPANEGTVPHQSWFNRSARTVTDSCKYLQQTSSRKHHRGKA